MEADEAGPGAPRADPGPCPSCGGSRLEAAGDGRWPRRVCARCGYCWEVPEIRGDGPGPVDSVACPGCSRRSLCESRPTWLADSMSAVHALKDGTRALIRPLLYSDRWELAVRFQQLSLDSRRLRFLSAPEQLSDADLEYLTNLDYHDHFALAAFATDEPGAPGIGVARYIRTQDQPALAEAAVTVVDRYQRRGLGTLLLTLLAEVGVGKGVTAFVAFVRWENIAPLNGLQEAGARITAEEPGIARVELDLPGPRARRLPRRRSSRSA